MAENQILVRNASGNVGTDYAVESDLLANGANIVLGGIDIGDGETRSKVTSSNPLPITASSLPLPTGAANQITLTNVLTTLEQILGFESTQNIDHYNATASDTSDTILSENLDRKQATFYNDADKSAYLKIGSGASTTSFTIKMDPGGYYELPRPCPTVDISCVWGTSPTGAMRIAEFY